MEATLTGLDASTELKFQTALTKRCIRVVLYLPDEDAILMLSNEGRYQLPRICGDPARKVAAACYAALRLCGISAIVLERLSAGIDWTLEQIEETYLLEVLAINRRTASLNKVRLQNAADIAGVDETDRRGIRRALEHLTTGPQESSLTKYPGWVSQALNWADTVTGAAHASPVYVEQISVLPHSVVLRLASPHGDRFLKWMPPEIHEARPVQILASGGTNGLPTTLAYEERRGWWLTEAARGASLAEQPSNIESVHRSLETLGELQQFSGTLRDELVQRGLPRRNSLTSATAENVCAHSATRVSDADLGQAIRSAWARSKGMLDDFTAGTEGLVHPDADPVNLLFDEPSGSSTVLDWAFCYWGPAALSGQYLLYRVESAFGFKTGALWSAYIRKFTAQRTLAFPDIRARVLMLFEFSGRLLRSYHTERCELARYRLYRRLRNVLVDLARLDLPLRGV